MSNQQLKNHLVWFRNDLRIHDNIVLYEACKHATKVVAIYCLDPQLFEKDVFGFKKTEKFRAKFLLESLTDLKLNLEKLNITLLIFHQKPEVIIPEIYKNHQINTIFYQKEWTSDEETIEKNLQSQWLNVGFKSFYNQFLYDPNQMSFQYKDTPKVFTAFRNKIEKYEAVENLIEKPKTMPFENLLTNEKDDSHFKITDLGFDDFETDKRSAFPFKGGESQALQRVNQYLFETHHVATYKQTRNGLIGVDYSTKFSPWLANGSLSARYIYWQIKAYEDSHVANDSTYWVIFELLWRDYFKYVSLKHQNDLFKLNGITQRAYQWSNNKKFIQQWIDGETDEPFVNANMLELKQTGWMSNRGRQNVASYFAKQLKLDWRIGAAYFESMLLDYDVHSNYGNWQYVAGVGNDPRDRQFNIQLQAKNYDPNKDYQNLWLN